jgi:hypothetical protein
LKPGAEMPVQGRAWLAFRISVAGVEKYEGVIRAHSREEAEAKAYAAFGALFPTEKSKVYVTERVTARR